MPDIFRFTLDKGALDDEVQETTLTSNVLPSVFETPDQGTGRGAKTLPNKVEFNWRRRRPIPKDDEFFENVWRDFRVNGNIY